MTTLGTPAPVAKEQLVALLGPRIAVKRDVSSDREGNIHLPDSTRTYLNTGTIVHAGNATPLVQHILSSTDMKDRSNAIFHLMCHNPDAVGSGFSPGMRVVFEDMEAHETVIAGESLWVMMDVSVIGVLGVPTQEPNREIEESTEPEPVVGRIG